ncbi:MAG: type II toxin-antitoxin system prevent-host-death family antitoxin [Lentisphaeria bacterium]|nr:type II toxin-antitoxin system prevent-host-death family antitoxin [Lentisphaeria bacterium]
MTNVNIGELKDHLSQFLAEVEHGGEVAVCRRNVPVARLISVQPKHANRTALGRDAGSVAILGDLTEPAIPASDWEMFGGSES